MIEKFFSYLESKGYRPQDEIYQIIIDLSKLDCIYLRPNNSIIIKSTKRLILEDYFNNKKIFNFPNFQYVRICVLKGLKEPPRCPVCGKIVSIMGKANREGKNSGTQFNKTCGDPNCTNEWVKMQSREKYGTDYPQQSEKVKEKSKKSNIEKYGVSCTLLTKEVQEKTKQTNLKKYGAEHASSSSIIKERVKETNIKNGFWAEENIKNRRILNESRSQGISIYSTQENFEKILKEKGYVETENVFQLLEVLFNNNKWISINKNNKFILNTSSKVNNSLELINYFLKSNNIDPEIDSWNCLSLIFEQSLKQRPHCPYCGNVCKDQEVSFSGTCGSQECINKLIKDSTFKNFGIDNPNTLPEIKEKIKRTTLERHGVDNAMKSEVFKRKSRKTNLERYGVEYATQNLEIKEKIKETNIKRYGGPSPLCSEEIKEKSKLPL